MMFLSKKDLRSAFLPGILALLAITVPAVFFSCYPGDPITPADTDVVATFYNPAADFSSLMTYAMPDSVPPGRRSRFGCRKYLPSIRPVNIRSDRTKFASVGLYKGSESG